MKQYYMLHNGEFFGVYSPRGHYICKVYSKHEAGILLLHLNQGITPNDINSY